MVGGENIAQISFIIRKALDKKFVKSIKDRTFSIEQLDNYYVQLTNEKKSAIIDFIVSSIMMVVGFYFLGRSLLNTIDDYLRLFLIILPLLLMLFYDFFYLRIKQFKSAVKKGYPELKDRYK